MNELISICIPTYNRPQMLAVALESCMIQDYKALEIVVGDDSSDDATAAVVKSFSSRRHLQISFQRNVPPLGQNANVQQLFQRANGDRLVLLHDDDVLLAGAVTALSAAWQVEPEIAVAFGKQEIITPEGFVDRTATDQLNRKYGRESSAGLIASSLRAALLQQMPNDGYMIRTDTAREIGYRSDADVGVHCDLDFTLRLGAALGSNKMYLIDRAISQYRISPDSISNDMGSRRVAHPRAARALCETIDHMEIPASLTRERHVLMKRFIDAMVKGYAIAGERSRAIRLFLSNDYGWKRRLSRKGAYHLAIIIDPRFDRLRRYGQ